MVGSAFGSAAQKRSRQVPCSSSDRSIGRQCAHR
jgi:hypothetical protein